MYSVDDIQQKTLLVAMLCTHLGNVLSYPSTRKILRSNEQNDRTQRHYLSGRSPKVVALFSATNFSSNIIELIQLHDTIQIKWNYA